MKFTLDGKPFGFELSGQPSLEQTLLALMGDYHDNHRGNLLTIELDPDDILGVNEISANSECVDAFRGLAERVNKMWTEKTRGFPTVEEGFGTPLPLPDPKDIKLEVYYNTYIKNDEVVMGMPAIQVLTKRWLGLMPHPNGGYYLGVFQTHATP